MGATVFLQGCAWTVRLNSGDHGYIWAEETYDKKDGRQAARWCTMVIGRKEDVTTRIFRLAQSLPGGMLQTPSQISASGFIKKNLEILESARLIELPRMILRNSKIGFYDAITDKNREHVIRIFEKHGKSDWAKSAFAAVQDGGQNVMLDVASDFEVIAELTSTRHTPTGRNYSEPVVFTWQLLDLRSYHGTENSAPKIQRAKPTIAAPQMEVFKHCFSASRATVSVAVVDGQTFMGSDYMVESELIAHACDKEFEAPGYYQGLLKSFRTAKSSKFEAASFFQYDTKHLPDDHWLVGRLNKVTSALFGQPMRSANLSIAQIDALGQRSPEDQYWAVSMMDNAEACKFIRAFSSVEQASLFEN